MSDEQKSVIIESAESLSRVICYINAVERMAGGIKGHPAYLVAEMRLDMRPDSVVWKMENDAGIVFGGHRRSDPMAERWHRVFLHKQMHATINAGSPIRWHIHVYIGAENPRNPYDSILF